MAGRLWRKRALLQCCLARLWPHAADECLPNGLLDGGAERLGGVETLPIHALQEQRVHILHLLQLLLQRRRVRLLRRSLLHGLAYARAVHDPTRRANGRLRDCQVPCFYMRLQRHLI